MLKDTKQLVLLYGLYCMYNLYQAYQADLVFGTKLTVDGSADTAALLAYAGGLYYLYSSVSAKDIVVYFLVMHFAVYYALVNNPKVSSLTFKASPKN